MSFEQMPRKALALISALMILAGVALAIWSLTNLPIFDRSAPTAGAIAQTDGTPSPAAPPTSSSEPSVTRVEEAAGGDGGARAANQAGPTGTDASTAVPETPSPIPEEEAPAAPSVAPIAVVLEGAPPSVQTLVASIAISQSIIYTTSAPTAAPVVRLDPNPEGGQPVQDVVFAAATRFDTIFPVTTWPKVQAAWVSEGDAGKPDEEQAEPQTEAGEDAREKAAESDEDGDGAGVEPTPEEALASALDEAEAEAIAAGMYVKEADLIEAGKTDPSVGANLADEYDLERAPDFTSVAVLSDTLPLLTQILDEPGPTVRGYADMEEVIEAAWADEGVLVLVPFDELDPRLATLAIDGQNPIENANRFDIDQYPFIATLYAHVDAASPAQQEVADAFLAQIPPTNRDPNKLTVLAMTGVTAMVRFSAAQIDRYGPEWVAEVVGPELAAADITHISNEVPFVPGCETNTNAENFNFCSPPSYMKALEDSGVDIIGLTGNHQNDYGREAALASLDFYEENGLPVYGGGRDKEAAFAPLYIEHNGNRLAFLGANSYGPEFAWATDALPGSAKFDLAIMSATIRSIKQKDLADVVLPELQYQESYDTTPLFDQRQDFNALVRAGADIVTGVQSHVPQGVELAGDKMILYGLGNLYFDQMWTHPTREGLIVKHTFYDGRHIGAQILTTLLYDYAQPRWTSADERESLLQRVFDASYWNIDQ